MKKNILIEYGQVIRKIRHEKCISQESYADMCNLHRTYVSDVELGKRNISLENIEKMADALDIKISEIFREIEDNAGI